jgi:ABC-type glycerol-3-phosphate transport system substrate-binding protein
MKTRGALKLKKKVFFTVGIALVALLLGFILLVTSFDNGDTESDNKLNEYKNISRPKSGIVIDAKDYSKNDNADTSFVSEMNGRNEVLKWNEKGALEWKLEVPEDGSYNICLGYFPIEGRNRDIEFNLYIDGKSPEGEVTSIKVDRLWKDAEVIKRNANGNEMRPKQEEERIWYEEAVKSLSKNSNLLQVELKKGEHTLRLQSIREPIILDYLRIVQTAKPESYSSYKQSVKRPVCPENIFIKVQAENAYLKSSSSLYPTFDRTSPLTEPYHPTQLRLNTIGKDNWDDNSSWISWKVNIPEEGLYKIGVKYHQNNVKGFFVSRKVYIDNQVPFENMEDVIFPYDVDWKNKVFGSDENNPYMFYLTKGEHELKMEVTLGKLGPVIDQMQKSIYELNDIYRKIIMITGTTPDQYRDYELDKNIPDLIPSFEKQIKNLDRYSSELDNIWGGNSAASAILLQLSDQMESFINEPYTIQQRLDNFQSNISALADWMLTAKQQPLELDYLFVASKDQAIPKAKAGMFEKTVHEIRAFAGSFTQDYSNFSNFRDGNDVIDVWIGLGRDQAYVIKRLIDESFTPETGIKVNLNLVQGALLKATVSGNGPDVNLFTKRGEVMNLAFRGALAPLDQYEGFDKAKKVFMASAFTPYIYENKSYGMPENQEFFMMFYRKDIFKELDIKPPETWEDLFKIAPTIQTKNLQIGLPYENLDAMTLMNSGIGTLNIFPTLLLQNGSNLYNKNHTSTMLDETDAFKAFKTWTDYYNLYDYPLYKDDFNRFRTGEMPLVISNYKLFNRLTATAPEIYNEWEMTLLPGVRGADGSIDRETCATGTAAVILEGCKNKAAAWKFLQWWSRGDVQSKFAVDMETELTALGRYTPANQEAFKNTNWTEQEQQLLLSQWKQVKEVPEIPGGYYTSRNLDNAFRDVVFEGENPRESLYYWNKAINDEIKRKRYELGLEN